VENSGSNEPFGWAVVESLPGAIAVLDLGGVIQAVNQNWIALGATEGGDLMRAAVGANYLSACRAATGEPTTHAAEVADAVETVLEERSDTVQFDYAADTDRWFTLRVVPSTSREGQRCVVVTHTEITPRKRKELALAASAARYREIVELTDEGIWMIDANSVTTFVNGRMAALLGYRVDQMIGVPLFEFIHADARELADDKIERRRQGIAETHEFSFLRKDGTIMESRLHTTPVFDEQGSYQGAIAMVTDVTGTRQLDRARRAAQQELNQAFAHAPIGMALVATDGRWLQVNRALCRLVGHREADLLHRTWREITVTEDLDNDQGLLDRLLARDIESCRIDRRLLHADGHVVWVTMSLSVETDDEGSPLHFIAQIEDITDRKAAEHELRRQQMDILTIAGIARDVATADNQRDALCQGACRVTGAEFVTLWEADGAILTLTATAGTSLPRGTMVDTTKEDTGIGFAFLSHERFFVPDIRDHPGVSQRLTSVTRAISMAFEPVQSGPTTEGVLAVGWSHHLPTLSPRLGSSIRLLAAEMGAALERGRLLERLNDLARTDALTGLPNRRVWDDRLALENARAERTQEPFIVAVLDLDHFKGVNDRGGHLAGDAYLRDMAVVWSRLLRGTDLLARLGGDEFGLLLTVCNEKTAEEAIDRMRQALPLGLSCSAGLATWTPFEPVERLVVRADRALYAAKASGRSTTCSAD
jgi:diguanylate cyclase (GGDEF)-like protein/PAS domain S-box-containing protein